MLRPAGRFPRTVFCASLLAILVSAALFAGFASSEIFLPDVGKVAGTGGAQFYTTVWVTNLSSSNTVNFTFELLLAGQANSNPQSFTDTLAAGETKVYEDVIGNTFHLSSANGGARIVSTGGEVFVSERIYNQPAGTLLSASAGQFYSGVPKGFSIGSGESASLQGVYLGSGQAFRYNFILLETSGQSCTAHVQAFDGTGALLGSKDVNLDPYEQLLLSAGSLASSASSTNARITATVTVGTGTVLFAGSQVGNSGPQDQSGFEMSFKDSLLGGDSGGACTLCVTSLNGLTGAVTIAHGANTTVNVAGNTITIDAVSGSGTGLTAVSHDNSLTGSGTVAVPLAIANGQVVRSLNGLHDAVTLAAGTNITLTPSGNTVTIAGTAAGLTLPYSATVSSSLPAFWVTNSEEGGNPPRTGIEGDSVDGPGVGGFSTNGSGVEGATGSSTASGVYGLNQSGGTGVTGESNFTGHGTGVYGISSGGDGVLGQASSASYSGVEGMNTSGNGIYGHSTTGSGTVGESTSGIGVEGLSTQNDGVFGQSSNSHFSGVEGGNAGGPGVNGHSSSGDGVTGSSSGGNGVSGYADSKNSGVYGSNAGNGPGVNGTGTTGDGVDGSSTGGFGVYGTSSSRAGVYGTVATSGKAGAEGHYTATSGTGYGVHGGSDSASGYGVYSTGNFGGTGAKFFVEPHPTDPTKEIRFVCLEGPESGTYFRGSGKIVNGFATIDVPESFRMVTAADGLTVVTTPVGAPAVLFVASESLDKIVIQGSSDVAFHYVVNGIRKAFANFQPIVENTDFVPSSSDARELTSGLPEESVRRLKVSGILNSDGSINLETAHRLGWDGRPGWNDASTSQ